MGGPWGGRGRDGGGAPEWEGLQGGRAGKEAGGEGEPGYVKDWERRLWRGRPGEGGAPEREGLPPQPPGSVGIEEDPGRERLPVGAELMFWVLFPHLCSVVTLSLRFPTWRTACPQ
jgi:hypothetical protein